MKNKKHKNKAIPLQVLATRRGNREAERLLLGEGFHARTRAVKNKKRYTRKQKHRNTPEE